MCFNRYFTTLERTYGKDSRPSGLFCSISAITSYFSYVVLNLNEVFCNTQNSLTLETRRNFLSPSYTPKLEKNN